jgi:hypothetical protein
MNYDTKIIKSGVVFFLTSFIGLCVLCTVKIFPLQPRIEPRSKASQANFWTRKIRSCVGRQVHVHETCQGDLFVCEGQ